MAIKGIMLSLVVVVRRRAEENPETRMIMGLMPHAWVARFFLARPRRAIGDLTEVPGLSL